MSLDLCAPDDFPAFPYERPYDIQNDLMKHLYNAIEKKHATIIESPTGTGKTLSLLCSTLTWLLEDQDRARKGQLAALPAATPNEPDWVLAHTLERRRRELEDADKEYELRLAAARKKEAAMRKMLLANVRKRAKLASKDTEDVSDDEAFLPDGEGEDGDGDNFSPAVRDLMARFQKKTALTVATESDPTCTKIFYASRTHSQLSQILPEMRKLRFQRRDAEVSLESRGDSHAGKLSVVSHKRAFVEDDEENSASAATPIRSVSLGSRKQLCINEELKARSTDIDEACRQMINEKDTKRCPYLPRAGEDVRMLDFRDQILASPKDIEELAELGRISSTCPYFGSRAAIPQAQLVTLPYNLLLQSSAREALGIDLKGNAVVVDEAHNLIPTLLSLSSVFLPRTTLSTSFEQLSQYWSRFRTRLSSVHALHLKRLIILLKSLQAYALEWKAQVATKGAGPNTAQSEVMTVGELMHRLGRSAEGVNLLEIASYLKSSKVARKINGYSDKLAEKAAKAISKKSTASHRHTNPPLHTVEAFIIALTTASDDGRVTISMHSHGADKQADVGYKYQLLNPATYFSQVVDEARSVVLAGGTMSPMSDYVNQLFAHLPTERLSTFSCGHIIPAQNLRAIILPKGPRGGNLEFKFGNRDNTTMIAELGQIISNLTNIVPAGIVVFLPSYKFLHMVMGLWESNGTLARFAKKKVFSEPQNSSEVEAVLKGYSAEIASSNAIPGGKKTGALLFAVVGAKLSEGLNFSDDLARAVVIVGLPFANLGDPELKERMSYVKRLAADASGASGATTGAKDSAMELYENMCMNSVNQSIGRAIRHRSDWAALVLVDRRYGTARIRGKLPGWINESTTVTESFGQAMKELGAFYREKR